MYCEEILDYEEMTEKEKEIIERVAVASRLSISRLIRDINYINFDLSDKEEKKWN